MFPPSLSFPVKTRGFVLTYYLIVYFDYSLYDTDEKMKKNCTIIQTSVLSFKVAMSKLFRVDTITRPKFNTECTNNTQKNIKFLIPIKIILKTSLH